MRKNGKSNDKVDIVRGPNKLLPLDAARCRIVRERISRRPPQVSPYCSGNPLCGCGGFYSVSVGTITIVAAADTTTFYSSSFLFRSPPSPSPSLSPSVPRRRNMAPRQEIRPSTPSLPSKPPRSPFSPTLHPSLPRTLPFLLAPFLPPGASPPVAF